MIAKTNQLSVADQGRSQNEPRATRRRQASDEDKPFKSDLDDQLSTRGSEAAAAANAPAQHRRPAQVPTGNETNSGFRTGKEQATGADAANERLAGTGRGISSRLDPAEYMPQSRKSASSVIAGSSIAGLKPWNQDWVLEGSPKPAEDIHPLFGASQGETEIAEMQDALKQIKLASGMKTASGPQSVNPGAAQVSENLRSRGDGGVMIGPNGQVISQADAAEAMRLAQATGVLAGNLREQLKAAGASVEELKAGGKNGLQRKNGQINGQLAGGSGLSGGEFMNTLSMVRSPAQMQRQGQESMQQDPGYSGGGNGSRSELKLINGGKEDQSLSKFGGDSAVASYSAVHGSSQPSNFSVPAQPPVQVTGHVVSGSMQQDRLSHEAILGMTNGIHSMAAQGGGEMRIRLKPENLGELHLRIVTQGNEVGIQIQASDDKAKKILQDSIGGLKDSLASQSLTLGKVEFTVAQAGTSADARNDSRDPNQQSQSQAQYNQSALGQNAGDNRNNRSNSLNYQDFEGVGARPVAGPVSHSSAAQARAAAIANARRADGRLDVRA